MTATEWETIERVAKLFNFTIHEATEFTCRVITDKADRDRSEFWWSESEGFDNFFEDFYKFAYENGADAACRC